MIKEKYKTENKYQSLSEKTVRLWREDPNLNDDIEKDFVTRSRKKLRKSCLPYLNSEKELVEKLRTRRALGMKISSYWLRVEAKIIFADPAFVASDGWFRNFRRRWNIVKRTSTHVVQKLKEDYLKEILCEMESIRSKRYQLEVIEKKIILL